MGAGSVLLSGDPFSENDRIKLHLISELPGEYVLAVKMHHALSVPPYEVGLFGNSRVLMVSADQVGMSNKAFFNFGISAINIETSVNMVEQLWEHGKLPKHVLISFDNLEIDHPDGPVLDTSLLARWRNAVVTIGWLAKQKDVSLSVILHYAGRFLGSEWSQLRMKFSFEILRRLIEYRYPELLFRNLLVSYHPDGSRETPVIHADGTYRPIEREGTGQSVIARTMQRLGKIAAQGTRIVVYESPIYPGLYDDTSAHPSDYEQEGRRRWLKACEKFSIECHVGPRLGQVGKPPYWPDSTHAPAPLLGAWLRENLIK